MSASKLVKFAFFAVATIAAAAIAVYSLPSADAGQAYLVDRTDDVIAGGTACNDVALSDCSLRGAIANANLNPGPDTIVLPEGIYTLDEAGAFEEANLTGDLDITDDLTIMGDSENNTFVEAGPDMNSGIDRVFDVHTLTAVDMSQLTVRHGNTQGAIFNDQGGGIRVAGSLSLTDVGVRNNRFMGGSGGGGIGVFGDASITLLEVTLDGNETDTGGGGLGKTDGIGSVSISDTVVTDNTAGYGGGLSLGLSEGATIDGTDVRDNTATIGDGGGISIGADDVVITGGEITGNNATGSGGGLSGPAITVTGTVVANNEAILEAGGIRASGTFTNVIVANNSAPIGGGIVTFDLNLVDSTVTGNDAETGGGILVRDALTANGVTISANEATAEGGGIYFDGDDTVSLTNSTISGNNAVSQGGGIYRDDIENDRVGGQGGGPPQPTGPVSLEFVTVADNTSDVGAAIFDLNDQTDFSIHSSIIAGNTGGPACSGVVQSLGYNIEDGVSCDLSTIGDQQNTNPMLQDLTNNGGPTDTHALPALSAAINAADPNCPPPATDQRGVARPIDGRCDVGAFESDQEAPPTPTPSPTPSVTETPAATTAAPTETATPTPTPTGTPTEDRVQWGDNQCDGDVDPVDSLGTLRFVASLTPVAQTEPCPNIGDDVDVVEASVHPWGDTDCDGDVDTVDALAILRVVAELTPLLQTEPCPDIGSDVVIE